MNNPSRTTVGNSSATASQRSSSSSRVTNPRGGARTKARGSTASLMAIACFPPARRPTAPPQLKQGGRRGYGLPNSDSRLRGKSDVNFLQLAGRPFHRIFGRHALDRFGIHVDDDVFAQDLAGLAIGWAGVSGELPGAAGLLERQHDRILLP